MHLLVDRVPFDIPRADHQNVDRVGAAALHLCASPAEQQADGLLGTMAGLKWKSLEVYSSSARPGSLP